MNTVNNNILEYITDKYDPICVILYGSYADGSNGPDSDFDALAVTASGKPYHDTSIMDGVRLDLFVYPAPHFEGGTDCEEIVQIYHGLVALDKDGFGKRLMDGVKEYVDNLPGKSPGDVAAEVGWCEKMLARAGRGDPEGRFRWHWLLTDSLEIYFDALGERYWGPKKALLQMEREHPRALELYSAALGSLDYEALERWIEYIRTVRT